MKKNLLNNYIVELLDFIEENLSLYLKHNKREYLHHIRVAIKKIKAVYSFAEKVYSQDFDITKLKPLFNKAGKIREIHINYHLLNCSPIPPENLIEQLKDRETFLVQQIIKYSSRYSKNLKDFRKDVNLPELLPNKKTIHNYFEEEKKKANLKLKSREREDLHSYRIKIKKIMYVYDILPKQIQKKIELNHSEINKLQEKLGKWHDTYASIKLLSHKNISTKTTDFVAKLKEKEKIQYLVLIKKLFDKQQ